MRVLVVGASGMLGHDVVGELRTRGHEVDAPSSTELDLTDVESVARLPERGPYRWVLNCAAYTAVDRAESEPDAAANLNALGPRYLAMACALAGCRLLQVSTDYVFDGEKTTGYTEADPTNPLQVYGLTKRDGEENVLSTGAQALVVRTAWLYGLHGRCFPRSILEAWRAGKPLRVVDDQVGTPTYTPELARTLADLVEADPETGIYHAGGPEPMSWYEFALRTLKSFAKVSGSDVPIEIEPISTSQWLTPARRPRSTVLACSKLRALGIREMEPVDASLEKFAMELVTEWRTS